MKQRRLRMLRGRGSAALSFVVLVAMLVAGSSACGGGAKPPARPAKAAVAPAVELPPGTRDPALATAEVSVRADGIDYIVVAAPLRAGEGWGVHIEVQATNTSARHVTFWGHPAPRLDETRFGEQGETMAADGCYSGRAMKLEAGERRRWAREHGHEHPLRTGERIRVLVGFCGVRFAETRPLDPSHDLELAEVALSVSEEGVPALRLKPMAPRRR